jgi:hypothetical protein
MEIDTEDEEPRDDRQYPMKPGGSRGGNLLRVLDRFPKPSHRAVVAPFISESSSHIDLDPASRAVDGIPVFA